MATQAERLAKLAELRNPTMSVLKSVQVLKGDTGPMGPKGDKGDTPIKGKDYFTDEELQSIINYIQSNVSNGKDGVDGKNGTNGAAPAKGIDYWTEKDQKKIIEEAIKQLPKPKDGISPDAKKIAADVVKQISIPDTSKHITQEQLIDFLRRGGFRGGGGGSTGTTLALQTNGTPNGSQTTLNLKQGANVTITDDGVGGLTIDATGGGTGITRVISSVVVNTNAAAVALTDYVYLVSGTTTITMPTAVGNTNTYTIKNKGSAIVTVATSLAQTIDSSATLTINVPYAYTLVSDGSNWFII